MRYRRKRIIGKLIVASCVILSMLGIGFYIQKSEFVEESQIEQVESRISQTKGEDVTIVEEPVVREEANSLQNYAYACLDEEEKAVYDVMYETITHFKTDVKIPTVDIESMEHAYEALCSDYGNLFWTDGYVYTKFNRGENIISIEFSPQYTMTLQEKEEKQNAIDVRAEEMLASISMDASEYEKVKYVFETLIMNVDYVVGCKDNQNICSVFLYGETVCQGYAGATQYLLEKLGIQSSIVVGKANGESHAWNLVLIDGDYYYVDTTWGNSSYMDAANESGKKFVNYSFLCITTAELLKTHTIVMDFPLPECVDTANNYYIKEGLYFETDDVDQIGAFIAQKKAEGAKEITLKFSTKEIYDTVVLEMLVNKRIMDYCEGMDSLYYVENGEQNVLRLYLK